MHAAYQRSVQARRASAAPGDAGFSPTGSACERRGEAARRRRLATFLLRHVDHVAHGPVLEPYGRRVRSRGHVWYVRRDERGFRYELTPPVAVDVLPGVLRR